MPRFATILVSPHSLTAGWWDGQEWTENQHARCSNDILATAGGPPPPPFEADTIVWDVQSAEAQTIEFDVSLDVPGPDPKLFPNLHAGDATPWFPTSRDPTDPKPVPYDYTRGVYIASVRGASAPFILQLSGEKTP